MNTFGFHLLDFTPNAVMTMAVFAHLCENFVGVHPNVALFRHFFTPRVERGEPGSQRPARRKLIWWESPAGSGTDVEQTGAGSSRRTRSRLPPSAKPQWCTAAIGVTWPLM